MNRLFAVFLMLLLAGCAGVPLGTMTKFAGFKPDDLFAMDPEQLVLALNVDDSLPASTFATPTLKIAVTPKEPGAFTPVDKKLPLQTQVIASSGEGLAPAGKGRKWILHRLAPAEAQQLRDVQTYVKQIKSKKEPKGGSMSIGVGLESRDQKNSSALLNSQIESWMRLSRSEDFFKLWSGKLSQLAPRNP